MRMIPILITGFLIISIIYLIVKRIQDKENEDFEKRDN